MSYKIALKIKKEFDDIEQIRQREENDRKENNSDWDTDDEEEYRSQTHTNDDPIHTKLHAKLPYHRGALSEELHDAAWREDLNLMRHLVGNDPSLLEETDTGGQNLLHLAAFWGSLPVAETLVKMNIDVDAVNVHAQRPLDIAMQWGHVNVADCIRTAGGTSIFEDKILRLERARE